MSYRRIAGVSGIVGAVLIVIQIAMIGSGPGSDPTAGEIVSWAIREESTLQASLVLNAGTTFVLGIFVVGLYALLRDTTTDREPWPMLGLIGGVVTGALASVRYVSFGLLAAHPRELSEATGQLTYDLNLGLNSPMALSTALMLLGFATAILRTRALPGWLGYLGYGTAALALVGGLAVVPTIENTGLGVVALLSSLVWLVWTLIISVLLTRAPASTAEAAA